MISITKKFQQIKLDPSWDFADKTRKDTAYITHSYHRYPAKFIPQIASRLIKELSKPGDVVVDPFGGCGTTNVESKLLSRPSIGVDINPVAVLIAKAKKTAINPDKLELEYIKLKRKIFDFNKKTKVVEPKHDRIDYWFKAEEKRKIAFLNNEIEQIKNREIKNFFYCGFSNILKNSSIWMQKSNKPTRDLKKIPSDPFIMFNRQIKSMLKSNYEYSSLLNQNDTSNVSCKVYCKDARSIPTEDNSVGLVVTSPPYVTSYEYADLHQLSALWLNYTQDLSEFRKKFIGTTYKQSNYDELNSKLAKNIFNELNSIHKKTATEIAIYFNEMNQVFTEMYRILKPKGHACIVIGNTKIKGVEILNAEVFVEQMKNIGFRIKKIIKRQIPSKNLPSTRDSKTGQFTKTNSKNKILVYPTEYILVMKKL